MKRTAVIAIIASLALLSYAALAWSDYSYRPGTFSVQPIMRDRYGAPEEWIDALIEREGGLPKAAAELTYFRGGSGGIGINTPQNGSAPAVYPVAQWQISRMSISP